MNKKIFFFDMDGTIVDENSNVRPATTEMLAEARAKGHKLAIATGRPHADITKDLNKDDFDYLVANNGAYFYDVKADTFTDTASLSKELALMVFEIAKANNSMFAVHVNRQAYRIIFDDDYENLAEKNDDPNFKVFVWSSEETIRDVIEKFPVAQVSIRDVEAKVLKFKDTIKQNNKDASVHIANGIYLDVNPLNISKIVGVNSVLEKEGMSLDQAIAFGDSGNDIEMIEAVKLGIAMGNSKQDLLEIADEVIGNNNSDAIANKMKELI